MRETPELGNEVDRATTGSGSPAMRRDTPAAPAGASQPGTHQGISPTVSIAKGCAFEGLLTFRGETRIDGALVGEVVASGTLWLGETARVQARIEVDELIVEGHFEGDVVARRRLELSPTAHARGSFQAAQLSFADGCFFQGRLRCLP
jgi:cytoskeletal protein CcmA (bactofilin family)